MNITINGTMKSLDGTPDIASVLQSEGYGSKLVAVARNGEFVPRISYADVRLRDGDALEIVAPMQGG